MTTFRKGDEVAGLGRMGRTWCPRPIGNVTGVRNNGAIVRVQWVDCCVEDDMTPAELVHLDPKTGLGR